VTDDVRLGQLLQDRFLLQEKLGAGAMGSVYLAEQRPLGRPVAVKVLNPTLGAEQVARERFVREAKALSKLSHPNVVVLHDFGTADDGSLFLVMERVKGHPLRAVMRGKLGWERAARLAWGIARGLGAAHHEGVVHADLKPENVMVVQPKGEPEQVKLLDFGLARLSQQEGDTLTQAGTIMGTPRYLSPEQIQGVRDEPRSDLYALGVMLYEMVVGAPPFEAPATAMLLVSHLSETPQPPSARGAALPPELEALILTLLAKQPGARPADAGAVVETLGALLRAAGIDDGPSGPQPAAVAAIDPDQPTITDSGEMSWPPRVAGAPTGEVTLVFTDIQGSSALWESAPALMRTALDLHDGLMRAALARHGGYEVKTQGDAFMVAFRDPKTAVAWALDVQQRLLDAAWDEALLANDNAAEETDDEGARVRRGLRVRMGIYAGRPDCRPDPNTGRMDYYGPDVNRAARVEAAAEGGQVFIGGALAEGPLDEVAARLGGHPLVSHGEHRLKGIAEPVTIVELRAGPMARRTFPALVTAPDAAATNLGEARTHPIGRDADLASLEEALQQARLVTLLGPGGTGKTTLARHFGRQQHAAGAYPGGVWFVDLTDAVSAGGVVTSVARTLGLEGGTGSQEAAVAQLGDALAARGRVLLLLDNLEQVIGPAAPVVSAWLSAAHGLDVIATSRMPLALSEEQVLELGPLSGDAAVELFARRAQRALSDAERADARTLVERLDGMPLAIELAAGRASVLSPSQILERLDQRLDLLKGDAADRTDRQATLRGAIDWSWDLLSEDERSVFRQCGAFVGGFSLEAAEGVIACEADVVDALQALKSKSLLRTVHDPRGGLRFTLYESLRAYAVEQLEQVPEARAAVLVRHADWYLTEGKRHKAAVDGPRPLEGLDWLSLEQENLLAVADRFKTTDVARAVEAGLCTFRLAEARAPPRRTHGPARSAHRGGGAGGRRCALRPRAPVPRTHQRRRRGCERGHRGPRRGHRDLQRGRRRGAGLRGRRLCGPLGGPLPRRLRRCALPGAR
jgi:predicted ATPase/class 3 adenylate cyclase